MLPLTAVAVGLRILPRAAVVVVLAVLRTGVMVVLWLVGHLVGLV